MFLIRIIIITAIAMLVAFIVMWMQEARREHDEHLRLLKLHLKK